MYASARITHCNFTGSISRNSGGGALALEGSSSANVTSATFLKCVAATKGGAIQVASGSTISISRCTFQSNSARGLGGGACSISSSKSAFAVNTFSNNQAALGGGGAVLWEGKVVPDIFFSETINCQPCANEKGNCACEGTARFGKTSHAWRELPVTGSITCSKAAFGGVDPAQGQQKTCECRVDPKVAPLEQHKAILCPGSNNEASYGPCVATPFYSLNLTGHPTAHAPGYAGTMMNLIATKLDRYGQTINADSTSALQAYSSLGGTLATDPQVLFLGSSIAGLQAGRAQFSVAVKPTFSTLDAASGKTELVSQPFLYLEGKDVTTQDTMRSTVIPIVLSSLQACALGSVLSLDAGSTFPRAGACTVCKPGSYSLDPLASPSGIGADPACFNCPAGGDCTAGGNTVEFGLGNWSRTPPMFLLTSCPIGHKVVNTSSADNTLFSHDRQMCEVCGKGEECTAEACVSCSPCAPGSYKQAVSTEACAACPASTYREDEGATELSNCLACPPGADTGGLQGQTSRTACQCGERFYRASSGSTFSCANCPSGATCATGGFCALRDPSRNCSADSPPGPIPGTWVRSTSGVDAGKFRLIGCPAGYQTQNASHDTDMCHPCLETQYIINPDEDACEKCPPGLICRGDNVVVPVVENSTWLAENGVYKLQTCPMGYSKISVANEWQQQECRPCTEGTECVLKVCESCSPCAAGKYKDVAGTQACRTCPQNTYNPNTNSKAFANCVACPPGANTGGKTGQTNASDCTCPDRTYLVINAHDNKKQCLDCPVGAECKDRSCALRSNPFQCEIVGQWVKDPTAGHYKVLLCPSGYKLQNDTKMGLNIGCEPCPLGYYVQDSHDPNSVCRKCPSSATCVNGRPPVFNAVKMQGAIELELPKECDEQTVRQALAVQLGVDVSKIVLSSSPCEEQQRRAKQKITFEIVGETSELESLQKSLSEKGVSLGEIQAEGQQILEGEVWEQIDGVYYLRKCPPGRSC